ncbi:MAG: hypothetical protein ABH829_00415 [archaeon]
MVRRIEHKSVWVGLSVGGALSIVIGVLWFIFTIAGKLLETMRQDWIAALVIIVLGMLAVVIGDTVLMKKEAEGA